MSGFGLLGQKLGHSFSPAIHGLLGEYSYVLCEAAPEQLGEFLSTTALDGMNVTIPYKRAVLPYCRELSPAAKAIGSVNTLVRCSGGWYGDNTDAFGFRYLLQRMGYDPQGKRCTILGSGGASAAVAYVLESLGAGELRILSRSGRNDYLHLAEYADTQLLVNATPVGMYPDNGSCAAADGSFPMCEAAVDLIYHPLRTAFLLKMQREKPGILCENGLPMLVAQAARSAEQFTGIQVAETKIEEILCKLKKDAESIALIGMPGCGKTTVGQILAARMGRDFVDLDTLIAEKTGKSPEIWLKTQGEAAFRSVETDVLREVSKRTGIVLSCGGGTIMQPENEDLLRQNCRVIWMKRELCKLEIAGRPLSETRGLTALYALRRPIYERWADLAMENDGSPEDTADKIMEALK